MSVVSQPFQAAIPTPAKPTANGIDSVLRRSSRSQLAQPTALTNNSLLPPQSQSSVVSRAAKRKANAAIASSRASIGLDVAANVSGPALDEPSDDHEPLSKRQKQATEQKAPTKASLIVTLKVKAQAGKPKPNPKPAETRPLSWGFPQVWADTRAELSDALPYFNAYQGAAASFDGKVKGMLLDEDHFERAYIDEEVVITRAGGGVGTDITGKAIQMKNQDVNHFRIRSFMNNMVRGLPLQLIVGSNNLQCPSQIPFRYCVMGAFQITYIWAEKSGGHTVYKFRMEKIDLDHKSWWAAENSLFVPSIRPNTDVKALEEICAACQQSSKQVYKPGWMCLNAQCEAFWKLNGGAPSNAILEFSERFLAERNEAPSCEVPYPTVPSFTQNGLRVGQIKTMSVTRQCWRGIVCPQCGRCNQRLYWDSWKCKTPNCKFEYAPPREVIPAADVMGDLDHPYEGHAVSDDKWEAGLVTCEVSTHGLFKVHDYQLEHDDIKMSHLHSNATINAKSGGADDIFEELQKVNLGLQRLPMTCSRVSGTVTAHFSKNFGLPYSYVVNHPELSTSFQDAPPQIKEAMRRLTWAGKRAIGENEDLTLNECLAVGYFQGGHMGYHDDGEHVLGPNVVAWSLGCPATMKFRLKHKYYSGFDKKLNYHSEWPVLPTCYKPEERRKLNEMAHTMTLQELNAKAKTLLRGCPKNPPVIMEMKLRHGDFISMHGAKMQLYYEHEVVPTHELRFGLTGRFVIPEKVAEDQRSKGELDLDPNDAYDGDLQVYEDWKAKQAAIKEQASMPRQRVLPPTPDSLMTDAP